MRLAIDERRLLKEKLASLSQEAKLYLFGSRADDAKRGGDIDLLVVSSDLTKKIYANFVWLFLRILANKS